MIGRGRLEIEGVSINAGSTPLVQEIDLRVVPGEMLGLLGPNGAGKSSLLRAIYRVSRPAAGRVLVNGEDIWQRSATWCARPTRRCCSPICRTTPA
ncbi:ATP-binding cassette domain-containing protein [Mesobaculum littorinae]|uniref:ATP-binding cassette domain-containing protein n=1 Tax=Mesobaculum littorinae TaxID=2486419 RepID=UPI0019D4C029|nr:ABC transporter ATP-binding protein [Mesobaculum littorinae]